MKVGKRQGDLVSARVYGIKGDKATRKWTEIAEKDELLKDVRLAGKQKHNKVDSVIKKEAIDAVYSSHKIDIIIIASNDHGYSSCLELIKKTGVKAYVIGNRNAAKRLRRACTLFFCI